jgi:hypothetical protein
VVWVVDAKGGVNGFKVVIHSLKMDACNFKYAVTAMTESRTFLGIQDYAPSQYQSAEQLESELGAELHNLIGMPLESVWLMWDAIDDEWFADGPVILGLGGRQLEVCAYRFETLFVSLDAIDRSKPLDWYAGADSDGAPFDLRWVENPPIDGLNDIVGRKIQRIGAGEYAWELSETMSLPPWHLASMEFELEGACFAIENALDENALRFSAPAESEIRRTRWIA